MPEAQPENDKVSSKITVAFERENFEDPIADLNDYYKYDNPSQAFRNCVRVGLKIHQRSPEEFITLLNN